MKTQGPEHKYKYGAISATIWKRTHKTKTGETFEKSQVSLDRSYKDASGQWQSTNTLDANDIPKAILALSRAYEYIQRAANERASTSVEEESVE